MRMSDRDLNGEGIERRQALRALGAGAAVGGGLFAAPPVSARPEGVAVTPDDVEPPNPDVQVRKVDRSVKSVSSYYPLLTLSQDTVVSFIDDNDRSRKEKREARTAVADLRSKFPVRREREGNVTWYKLVDEGQSPTDADNEKFRTAGRAFANGVSGRREASTQYYKSHHRELTRDACEDMGLSSSTTDEIAPYADDPDDPDVDIGVPDAIPHSEDIEEGLETALNKILHHYGQYYDADAFQVYHDDEHDEDFGALGGATDAAWWHMYYADYYSGSTQNKYLGMATHYPADMGVPLHTGMGWEQANLEIYYDVWSLEYDWRIDPTYWLHSEYEDFVSDNWSSFRSSFLSDCDGCYYYYPIDDVEQAIRDLASYTGDYSYDVYHHILEEGDVDHSEWDWDTWSYMYDVTENCVNEVGHYVRGFMHDVLRD